MDWQAQVDGYCERLTFAFWGEPVNAITNAFFILAAIIMWPRVRGLVIGRLLCVILAVIGVGSFLFHTLATRWAGVADTTPIAAFILVYLYALGMQLPALYGWAPKWRHWTGAALMLAFIPFAAATLPGFARIAALGSSAGYLPVPLAIALFALVVARRAPRLAANMAIGCVILLISLTFRTLDMPICTAFPLGTHFLWHSLNALMLGWMIETYRRHMLEARPAAR